MASRSSNEMGQFWHVVRPMKIIASLCCAVRCKKSITASQRHSCSELHCCRLRGVTLHCPPPWKIRPAMRPFLKILSPLVIHCIQYIDWISLDREKCITQVHKPWKYIISVMLPVHSYAYCHTPGLMDPHECNWRKFYHIISYHMDFLWRHAASAQWRLTIWVHTK